MAIQIHFKQSRGNALFIVLIAVGLFAALTLAITNSNQGTTDTTREYAQIQASGLAQRFEQLTNAVLQMSIEGHRFNDIEFFTGGDCNPTLALCDSGADCLFAPEGGGLDLYKFSDDLFSEASGGIRYPGDTSGSYNTNMWIDCDSGLSDWNNLASSKPDRAFYLAKIKEPICRAYNKGLGYDGIPGDDTPIADIDGKYSMCIYNSGNSQYEAFQFLYAE